MKRIDFRRISIRNFMSVGPEPVEVEFKPGLNVITGFNRDEDGIKNGVGKSVVIDAFYWAVFGDSLRDLKKEFIVNRKVGKDCTVRLEFSDGRSEYVVERSLGPSRLHLFKDGVDVSRGTMPETNKVLRAALGATEEVFQDCVIMRANSTIPFMAKKKVDRKNFIESIFNLSIFTEMGKVLKEEVREERRRFDEARGALSAVEGNIAACRAKLDAIREEERTRRDRMEAERRERTEALDAERRRLDAASEALARLEAEAGAIRVEDDAVLRERKSALEGSARMLAAKRGEMEAEMRMTRREASRIEGIGNTCPTCNRPYGEDFVNRNAETVRDLTAKADGIASVLAKVDDKDREIAAAVREVDGAIAEVSAKVREAAAARERAAAAREGVAVCKERVSRMEEALASLEERYSAPTAAGPVEEMLAAAEAEMTSRKAAADASEHKMTVYNTVAYALGERGIRSFVVNKLLELLNGRIDHYLRAFRSTFRFTFDEMFNESLVDANNCPCMYANCSGAEQKKIDLAIGFAFLDVLKIHRQVEYNVAFYDEILDSSLDTKSLESLVEFIEGVTREAGRAAYIVTHKSDVALPNIVETVMLEKRNGYTTRIS